MWGSGQGLVRGPCLMPTLSLPVIQICGLLANGSGIEGARKLKLQGKRENLYIAP